MHYLYFIPKDRLVRILWLWVYMYHVKQCSGLAAMLLSDALKMVSRQFYFFVMHN